MSAKSAPAKERPLVTEGRNVPPKIAALLANPVYCSKIGAAWEPIKETITAVLMDLPLFCKKHNLDSSAVCLAANKILTTLEIFKDQAELDRTK